MKLHLKHLLGICTKYAPTTPSRIPSLNLDCHKIDEIYRAVDLTLKNNLKINVDFIFGLPGEDLEDIKSTIEMMKNLSKKGARIHAHSFIPLPQTPFSKESARKVNKLYKKEIENLIAKGQAFGNWDNQEKLASKITRYFGS